MISSGLQATHAVRLASGTSPVGHIMQVVWVESGTSPADGQALHEPLLAISSGLQATHAVRFDITSGTSPTEQSWQVSALVIWFAVQASVKSMLKLKNHIEYNRVLHAII